MTARRAGFTLIEIVGAVLLTVVILFFVIGTFIENGRQRAAATALMREHLSGVAALDLLASDFAGAIFLKRGEDDEPDAYPWRFVADEAGEFGATAIRFVTQAGPRANPAAGSSAWNEVAYFLAEDEDGDRQLWRWVSPHPPDEPSRGLPNPGDPGTMRAALGVASFGVRFLDAEGAWVDEWDSTFTPAEQALPDAVEITLQLDRPVRVGEETEEPGAERVPGRLQTRRVALAMQPLDVAALIELATAGPGASANCFTIDQCLAKGESSWYRESLSDGCHGDQKLCTVLRDSAKTCWNTIQTTYPAIAARAPKSCAAPEAKP